MLAESARVSFLSIDPACLLKVSTKHDKVLTIHLLSLLIFLLDEHLFKAELGPSMSTIKGNWWESSI